jgi:tRNA A37 threonylcarbamoyladenosine dehydratase
MIDEERAFGGLSRLYGSKGYERIRAASVAVVGVGGVGSWAVEALARSGVAQLVLIDLDHVSESNLNRQLQATLPTLGMSKVQALRERIATIHPNCEVLTVEDFVTPQNWPLLLPGQVDAVIDACDQSAAKRAMALWALRHRTQHVCVGAAGGKQLPQAVAVEDLSATTHDPLLASLRQNLRRDGAAPRKGRIGLRCVFSVEAVSLPSAVESQGAAASCEFGDFAVSPALETAAMASPAGMATAHTPSPRDLSCHGYGSSVVVTATFGMTAVGECLRQLVENSG